MKDLMMDVLPEPTSPRNTHLYLDRGATLGSLTEAKVAGAAALAEAVAEPAGWAEAAAVAEAELVPDITREGEGSRTQCSKERGSKPLRVERKSARSKGNQERLGGACTMRQRDPPIRSEQRLEVG